MSIFERALSDQLAAQAQASIPFRQDDAVVIRTNGQRDAEGFYIPAELKNQDAFAQHVAALQAMKEAMGQAQPMGVVITGEGNHQVAKGMGYSDPGAAQLGRPFAVMQSPNTTVVQPTQRVSASDNGNVIVHY